MNGESLGALDTFSRRHIGPNSPEMAEMLKVVGVASLEELIDQTVPAGIRLRGELKLPGARSESEALAACRALAVKNRVYKSFIGMGYYGTITPPVILRNILENPGWYTQYTPYQAEISQGRLEALLNFQTMVSDLTGLPLANASMLDEGTAAAEAMNMCYSLRGGEPGAEGHRDTFFISDNCHPQTIAVVTARAKALGIKTVVGNEALIGHDSLALPVQPKQLCGVLLQYPGTDGVIEDYSKLVEMLHDDDILVVAATDLLACTLIRPPGEWGADIAVGSAQRFGVPMGFGGPHAAFMACKTEFTRKLPGRLVGVSRDVHGNPAYRLAIQTREQHIRREKATSNICTAQVLLAIMASMYAVYHGPEGLKAIALRIHSLAAGFANVLGERFNKVAAEGFDSVEVDMGGPRQAEEFVKKAALARMNVRVLNKDGICVNFDETTTTKDVAALLELITGESISFEPTPASQIMERDFWDQSKVETLRRTSPFLTHPVFNAHHSEHELTRYIYQLQAKDLSLTTSMIPLGSCTMKLNATSEMIPVTWAEFGAMHPFAPAEQTVGYRELFTQLEAWLAEITGFAAVSLQPNAGSQGEYAGLLVIRAYHEARRIQNSELGIQNGKVRDVCLIPTSAHGTNPASAVVAGLKVVAVGCDAQGNIDIGDLRAKAEAHKDDLACLMVTYPSTHGVFEEGIKEICEIVHAVGGQVYMDGANMNAQVGLTSPGFIGADVCHLNLHKTFCIPHGGGGPGVGPIGVAKHLVEFLPGHPVVDPIQNSELGIQNRKSIAPVSAAPWGSAGILPISWMYIAMMGAEGLKRATEVAILNANYMAKRLEGHYAVLFKGKNGRCAHEFILDCRGFEESAGVKVEDIAKRLMDYGFHAPTMSWPVGGTLMFEPTESEDKGELDRLCEAMIAIREEIRAIEEGRADRVDNALKHAPHTAAAVTADEWGHKYPRSQAAWPAEWVKKHKFWPSVGRIDNPWGDRNLVCTCPPMEA